MSFEWTGQMTWFSIIKIWPPYESIIRFLMLFFYGVSLKMVKHMPWVSLFVLVRSLEALSPRILER